MSSQEYYIAQGMPHIDKERRERLDLFGKYVAILPWFNADVLHKLYHNIFIQNITVCNENWATPKIRAITCGDFLQSPLITRIDVNVFIIKDKIKNEFRLRIEREELIIEIGQFMLAYAQDCYPHFLSPKYREVFYIEGNLIINPDKEGARIAKHIIRQLNQTSDLELKKKAIAYYINRIENKLNKEQGDIELISFFKGLEKFKQELPEEWETLIPLDDKTNEHQSLSISLPEEAKIRIKNAFKKAPIIEEQIKGNLHAFIVGINEYEGISPLIGAVNDTNRIEKFLLERTYIDKQNIYKLTDKDATYSNFEATFLKIIDNVKAHDTLLLYFAGYGGKVNLNQNKSTQIWLFKDSLTDGMPMDANSLTALTNKMPKHSLTISISDAGGIVKEKTQNTKNKIDINNSRNIPSQIVNQIKLRLLRKGNFDDPIQEKESKVVFRPNLNNQVLETKEGGKFTTTLLNALNSFNEPFTISEFGKKIINKKEKLIPYIASYKVDKSKISPKDFMKFPVQDFYKSWRINVYIKIEKKQESSKKELEEMLNEQYMAKRISLVDSRHKADYIIYLADQFYYITKSNTDSSPPLIHPIDSKNKNALTTIFNDIVHISIWEFIKNTPNNRSQLNIDDIQIEFAFADSDKLTLIQDEITINGDESFRIKVTNNTNGLVFISLLYLDEKFSVQNFFPSQEFELGPNKSYIHSSRENEEISYRINKNTKLFNRPRIKGAFKLIASTSKFDLESLSLGRATLPEPRELLNSKRSGEKIKQWRWYYNNIPKPLATRTIKFNIKNPSYNEININELYENFNTDAAYFLEKRYLEKDKYFSFKIKKGIRFKGKPNIPENHSYLQRAALYGTKLVTKTIIKNRYQQKIKKNPSIIKIVAEGDSWFKYPYMNLEDISDLLSEKYAVYNLGDAGDSVVNMYRKKEYKSILEKEKPDFFLLSAGANDVLGPQLTAFLKTDISENSSFRNRKDLKKYMTIYFYYIIEKVKSAYRGIFNDVKNLSPKTRIIVHGYDYIIPLDSSDSGWVGQYLIARNMYKSKDRKAFIRAVVDGLNDMFMDMSQEFPHVHHLDIRGTVNSDQWHDEVHPTSEGFQLIAEKFTEKIEELSRQVIIERIRTVIASDNLQKALAEMAFMAPQHLADEIISLQSQLKNLAIKTSQGLIRSSNAQMERSKIRKSILEILNKISDSIDEDEDYQIKT